jgi:hypothetical protein
MMWREWIGLKPRMADLASRILAEFRKQGVTGWSFDPNEQALNEAKGATINLSNLYLEYLRAPRSQRAALLQKYSAFQQISQQSIPKLWELAAKSIYAVVRSRADRVVTQVQFRDEQKAWPTTLSWPWIGDLEIRIAYDWGSHLSQVSEEFADTWGQTREAIKQRALQNLAALPKPKWENKNGVHELSTDTSYQESLLLVDKVIDQLSFKDSVVCIPSNRGVLLACDRNRLEVVLAMIDQAFRNIQERPWPMTATLLTRGEGTWQEYQPTDEAAVRAGELQRMSTAVTYADQKAALEAHYQRTGTDIYVATFGLFRRPADGNAMRSWCSWTDGVHSSLPQTDLVALVRRTSDGFSSPLMIPWSRTVALLGHYMQESDEFPSRYVVQSAFTDAEWAALAAESSAQVSASALTFLL